MATMTLQSAPAANELMLSQTRVIRAPRARVYEAWTQPGMVMKWFGSANSHCSNATVDARVGGEYRIDVMPNVAPPAGVDGTECGTRTASAFGHFTKVVPNELLQFTWSTDWHPGEESLVTVSLKDVAEGTELTLVHEQFLTEASRDGHKSGWAACFEKMATLLEV